MAKLAYFTAGSAFVLWAQAVVWQEWGSAILFGAVFLGAISLGMKNG